MEGQAPENLEIVDAPVDGLYGFVQSLQTSVDVGQGTCLFHEAASWQNHSRQGGQLILHDIQDNELILH